MPADYPYVRKWEALMGAKRYYLDDQLARARADGAPQNAIHRRDDGTWATTDDVTRADTRHALGLPPLEAV